MRTLVTSIAAATVIAMGSFAPALAGGSERGSLKDGPLSVASAYDWTGTYFGLQVGYGFGDAKLTDNLPTIGFIALPALASSHDADGLQGGIQLGARRQIGSLVIGAELSLSGSEIDGNTGDCFGLTTLIGGLAPGAATANCKSEVNWMGTALAKLGWAHRNWLFYGAAGWTVAGIDHEFALAVNPVLFPLTIRSGQSDVADGFTIGAGVEHALGNGISLGVEYLHRDLENRGEGLLLGGLLTTGSRDIELNSVTAKVNVKW